MKLIRISQVLAVKSAGFRGAKTENNLKVKFISSDKSP